MKYKKFKKISLPNRKWIDNEIEKEPIWCSVDLRDGNQALLKPMNIEKKLKLFNTLVQIGFKEIEIGFPSASEIEFTFCRKLIEENLIPDDVTIQVLTQSREPLIIKTFEAIEGSKNVILHFYNSTSTLQREIVFEKSKDEIIDIAINGAKLIKKCSESFQGNLKIEYSPESFTGTELDFVLEISNKVIKEFNPVNKNFILNLPATVEMAMPNIYADQIEYIINKIKKRDDILISIHTHNDRGTAVAATELALLAGADRVEGTILGNGERTGNVDILTLALNMFTQGIPISLDFSNIDEIVQTVEECTEIKTHIRHPYAGKMVYTAFSGSHQDAIKKGMDKVGETAEWKVPYLPIDPSDVGRDYEKIIVINSQSGKGGVSHILKEKYSYIIPKEFAFIFSKYVQKESDATDGHIEDDRIREIFENTFVNKDSHCSVVAFDINHRDGDIISCKTDVKFNNELFSLEGNGNGPISAFNNALYNLTGVNFEIEYFNEYSIKNDGADSVAVSVIKINDGKKSWWGCGKDVNTTRAFIKSFLSALNFFYDKEQ